MATQGTEYFPNSRLDGAFHVCRDTDAWLAIGPLLNVREWWFYHLMHKVLTGLRLPSGHDHPAHGQL